MSIRMLPALCAGVILAACAPTTPEQTGAISTGAVRPGSVEDGDSRNISNRVVFGTDSAVLSPDAQGTLQRQAHWLQLYPQHKVIIEGHADERGTREYNLALAERRAAAVADYLKALGLAPERVKTISYGKERPECTDANEACWSQNRRGVTTLDN